MLTDIQILHRPAHHQPVAVLFEQVCRENGNRQRHTKPRRPSSSGKTYRFHKSLRAQLLDHIAPFESLEAAIDA